MKSMPSIFRLAIIALLLNQGLTAFGQTREFIDSLTYGGSWKDAFELQDLTVDSAYSYSYQGENDSIISAFHYFYHNDKNELILSEVFVETGSYDEPILEKRVLYKRHNDGSGLVFYTVEMDTEDAYANVSRILETTHEFDANGYLLKRTIRACDYYEENPSWKNQTIIERTYDSNGNILTIINWRSDIETGAWVYKNKTENNYGAENTIISSYTYLWGETGWEKTNQIIYDYDDINNVITQTNYRWDETSMDYLLNQLTIDTIVNGEFETTKTYTYKWSVDKWVPQRQTFITRDNENRIHEWIRRFNFNTVDGTFNTNKRDLFYFKGEDNLLTIEYVWNYDLNDWVLSTKIFYFKHYFYAYAVATDVKCKGDSDGTAKLIVTGGQPPYSILWDDDNKSTTDSISSLAPGRIYSYTVSDDEGQFSSGSVTVEEPLSLLVAEITGKTDVTCYGDNNGSASASASGGVPPYDFFWIGPSYESYHSNTPILELFAGDYLLKVIDSNGCEKTESLTINSNSKIEASYEKSAIICAGSEDGFIDLEATGGVGEYTYTWSNGAETKDISGLSEGVYQVNIKDELNCQYSEFIEIEASHPYPNQEICLVTVDTDSEYNTVIWEQTPEAGIVSYNIYRESNSVGAYNLLGTVPYGELSMFVDETSDSRTRAYQYKISVTDTCGNESQLSNYHRTLLLSVSIGIGTINLQWSNYELENGNFVFSKYLIYRGSSPSNMEVIDEIGSNYSDYIDNSPAFGTLYYQIAGVVAYGCNPDGTKKGVNEEYNLVLSNLQVKESTGLSEKTARRLKIMPNPFSDRTRIEVPLESNGKYTVVLTDISGRIIKTLPEISESFFELERGSMPAGVYYLLFTGDINGTEKIIVK